MKSKIPYYYQVHCNNQSLRIEVCPYYMHEDCPEKCAYALEIRGIGVGALMPEDINRLEKEVKENGL